MLDFAFKNIKRRKARTILTTLGIIVGITAIVALGSLSEGLGLMVNEELGAVAGKIILTEAGASMTSGYQGSDITPEQISMVSEISGVEEVVPMVFYMPPFGPGAGGPPTFAVIGIELDKLEHFIGKEIVVEDGRKPDDDEREVALVGYMLRDTMNVRVGDFYTYREKDFEVVGIAEETGISDVDMSYIVPLADLQDALGTDNYQVAYAVLEDPDAAEDIADEIEDADDTIDALTFTDISRQVSGIIDQISLFTIGIGAIAAFVGGLGVLNTMIMAVMERKREIGVMKAIGATRKFILMQILSESTMLSLIGGLVGLFLGWMGSFAVSAFTGGFIEAVVTPGLALGAIGFAMLLGFVGGLYPAWKATKLDPVEALRG
jgi:putative ABC transport system permease protein